MIIGIDCYQLVKGQGKSIGIYNYTKNLLDSIIPNLSMEYKIVIFCNEYNKLDFMYDTSKTVIIKESPLSIKNKVWWEILGENRYVKRHNVDLLFSPRGYVPQVKKCKSCITIHDLIPFYYYENHKNSINTLENFYIRTRLKYSAKNADRIITISEYSKQDIVSRFKIDPNKITVIYNGIDKTIKSKGNFHKNYKYLFSVSSELPHKNYIGLLKSYELYYKTNSNPLKLIVCGIKNFKKYAGVISDDAFNNIEHLGYISDEELGDYYKNCSYFVFLSNIEGFGFPPLEAMKYGAPVICSNSSCMPEILEDSVVFADPSNYNEISKAMMMLENSVKLREEKIKKSIRVLNKYSWEFTADKVLNVLKDLIEGEVKW